MNKTLLLTTSIIMLCGCGNASTSKIDQDITHDSLLQIENQVSIHTSFQESISAGKGDAVFKPSGSVVYYGDPSVSDDFTVFCSKAGCQHNSEDCGSYIGNASEFIAYKDLWYYIRTMDDGSMVLFEQNPITNERTELKKVASKTEDNKYYFITMQGIMVSYDCIYLRVDQMVNDNTNPTGASINTTAYVEINLSTRKERTILHYDSSKESWSIVGGNGKCMMVSKYIPYNPQTSQPSSALYRMNLKDLTTEVVVDEEKGVLAQSSIYGNINADNLLTYCTEHEIHLYDLDTGEDRLLYQTNEIIISTNIFGQNVYYIYKDRDDKKYFMRGNTTGNTSIMMENKNNTEVNICSKYRTTENGYLGLMHDGQFGWLSQEDYYQENYDGFVPLR